MTPARRVHPALRTRPARGRLAVRAGVPVLALALALGASACGGDDEDPAPTSATDGGTVTDGGGTDVDAVDGPAFCSRADEITGIATSDLGGADPAAVEEAYGAVVTFFEEAASEAPEDIAPSVTVLADYLAALEEVFASVGYVAEDVPVSAFSLYDAEVAEATGAVDRWFASECGVDLTPEDVNGAEVDVGGYAAFLPSELDPSAPAPGPDATLDALWDACGTGDDGACDELFGRSPTGSQYEGFGATCGARVPYDPQRTGSEACAPVEGGDGAEAVGGAAPYVEGTELRPDTPAPGPEAALDELWSTCGQGGLAACDELYAETPFGSLYEAFAVTCGGREPYDPAAYDGCTDG